MVDEVMTDLEHLSTYWLEYKEQERVAIENRRIVEDAMKSIIGIQDNLDGTQTEEKNRYIIKVVGRIDRKVDADKVQELAAENGLTEHLASLFRWKPELNMAAWKSADEAITKPLAPAITAKPGRPSFSITIKEI